jgi:hypothetical protein
MEFEPRDLSPFTDWCAVITLDNLEKRRDVARIFTRF